jgi:hypothetical protein
MGLIEYEWLMTLNIFVMKSSSFSYVDFVQKGKDLVKLFQSQGCELIIALTHMRTYNDQ